MNKKRRIVMTGGGTAGHVMPNIALLDELKKKNYSISYIGSYDGIEKELIENENIRYFGISSGRLRRYFSFQNFIDPIFVMKGYFEARKILKKIKPHIVFSKGGFVSVPVVVAAGHLKIPVIIHESDMTPGLANKLSIRYANHICCTFPETLKFLPQNKTLLTGTPIREELFMGEKNVGLSLVNFKEDKPILLVVGGSTGAKTLNEAIRSILPRLLKHFYVLHLCGAKKTDKNFNNIDGYVQMEYAASEMKDFLAMADIIVSRAGANAIFELLALKKPNLLVPLPKDASRGDQILNANSFKKQGFSDVIEEEHITNDIFFKKIMQLYENREKYIEKMQESKLSNSIETIINLIDTI